MRWNERRWNEKRGRIEEMRQEEMKHEETKKKTGEVQCPSSAKHNAIKKANISSQHNEIKRQQNGNSPDH